MEPSRLATRARSALALCGLSVALVLPLPNVGLAGPVELLVQVALHPTDPDVIVLRYTEGGHGLFYSRDAGESWHLICRSAISADVPRSGPIAVTGDGHVMMGVFQGLYVDDGKGCGWSRNDFIGDKWVSDFVLHPSDPDIAFISTARSSPGVENGVVQRDAEGEYTDFGETAELLVAQLRVAPREDGLRFYERVLRGTDYLLRHSDDGRETFTEFPFTSTEGNLSLQAVDPSNPDRIVAVLDRGAGDDDVLVSDDRGKTLRLFMTVSQFSGIAVLPSGKVFVGEAGSPIDPTVPTGLWVADSLDGEPEELADFPVQCLAYQESTDTLFACQYRTFGKVDQQSGEYAQLFHFDSVEGFVDCGHGAVATACEEQLCIDYCTFGHFARAPVCDAYTRPRQVCGPCAAMIDEGADISVCFPPESTADAGAFGGAGTSATADASARPAGDAGRQDSGSSGGGGDDAGCGCSIVGVENGGSAMPMALGAGMGALFALRRRRTRRP